MTITNGYATLAQLKSAVGATQTTDDTVMEMAIAAASRDIDKHCGRRFWQDATVQVRTYHAENPLLCLVDDISTTSGLIVKSDISGVGAYDLTMTLTTDFLCYPLNAAAEVPVMPYEELRVVTGVTTTGLGFSVYGTRPGVQVTAKFGWPAVPDNVTEACVLQAVQLYKSKDAPFGIMSFGDGGGGLTVRSMHPVAAGLLMDFRKPAVG